MFNSLPACNFFCHLLIIFANSLEPDQACQNVGPDLDPNCMTERIFEKVDFGKKISRQQTSVKNYPACTESITSLSLIMV